MFGIDLDTPLRKEELDSLVESIAGKIVARKLETPSVLLLEMHKPLASIASQSILVAMPFLAPFIGAQQVADLSKLLRDRENVELLITRIEAMASERDVIRTTETTRSAG